MHWEDLNAFFFYLVVTIFLISCKSSSLSNSNCLFFLSLYSWKLTTAQYFTPSGEYINGKGIKPTIEEKDEEKQLDVALKWIKEQRSK